MKGRLKLFLFALGQFLSKVFSSGKPLSSQPNRPVLMFHPPLSDCLRKDLQARSGTVMARKLSCPLVIHQAQQLPALDAICMCASVFLTSPMLCCPYVLPLSFLALWLFLDSLSILKLLSSSLTSL